MIVLVGSAGFEDALAEEVGGHMGGSGIACVEANISPALDPAFARQVLPAATLVGAPSVARLAAGALDAGWEGLVAERGPWRLDAWAAEEGPLGSRASLVARAFTELLGERRRRRARERVDSGAAGCVVQLLLCEPERLYCSVSSPLALTWGGTWPAPFSAGVAPVAEDRTAPSTAYRKLEEAFAWLGRAPEPGERCVDLGAAPGGWTHVALARGAHVAAVDRAALDPRLAGHPRLVHERGDAFAWTPEAPVDWLLCDVIAEPERSATLLERWVASGLCRHFVMHLKFKGAGRYALAAQALARVRTSGRFAVARCKHLRFDKHELTLLGSAEPPSGRLPGNAGR